MPKSRLPVLNYLPAFEAAARRESVKAAAAELHVTHSAVSRNIRKLERQIGRPMFERRNRRIFLTSEGEILFAAVNGGFSQILQALEQLSRSSSPQRLVIAVESDFAALWLVPRLGDFCALMPDLHLDIRAEYGKRIAVDARIDCAIQYFEADTPPDNGEILFRSRLFPVCAPEVLQWNAPSSPEALGGRMLIFDRSKLEWQQYFRELSIKADLGPGVVLNQTALCMEAASRGEGIAMGDDFLADVYLSEHRLVKVFDHGFMSNNAYYFCVAQGLDGHPSVGAFRSWLLRSISQVRKGESRARAAPPRGDPQSR